MIENNIIEHDKLLRQEIIESQKTQADFLKWKLISVAAVASISFGLKSGGATNDNVILLVCLIPLLCAYVDLISLHIMIRIIAIGTYLEMYGNNYEKYISAVRGRPGVNPFVFEAGALHGSSIVFNLLIIVLGIWWPKAQGFRWLIILTGLLGIAITTLLLNRYLVRARGVKLLAIKFKDSEDVESTAQ